MVEVYRPLLECHGVDRGSRANFDAFQLQEERN